MNVSHYSVMYEIDVLFVSLFQYIYLITCTGAGSNLSGDESVKCAIEAGCLRASVTVESGRSLRDGPFL